MRTVSTKLDNRLHDKFLELCNEQDKCQSEFLRDLIKEMCEPLDEENRTSIPQDPDMKSPPEPTITVVDI